MKKIEKKALQNGLYILILLGVTAVLVVTKVISAWAFLIVPLAGFPLVKPIWYYIQDLRWSSIRVLRKALPKAGFVIEKEEWNDKHDAVRFNGKYQGYDFIIVAYTTNLYVWLDDMIWERLPASDSRMPKILEALNEVNTKSPGMSVVISEPDTNGIRSIHTITQIVLPGYSPADYLDYLMCEMLNRRLAFVEAFNKERPYMRQRRGPVGFNAQEDSANATAQMSPAAQAGSGL